MVFTRARVAVIALVIASGLTGAGAAFAAGGQQPLTPTAVPTWQSFHRYGPAYTYGSDFGVISSGRPATVTVSEPTTMVVEASFTYHTSHDPPWPT